jgi:hypothetical protein
MAHESLSPSSISVYRKSLCNPFSDNSDLELLLSFALGDEIPVSSAMVAKKSVSLMRFSSMPFLPTPFFEINKGAFILPW